MYRFPVIEHLDEVREAIAGADEFIIAEREFGYVVNYLVNMGEETFPAVTDSHEGRLAAIRRECRGLIFDKNKKVIARRYHKFFNVNERQETHQSIVPLHYSHNILEKLDGSMITPIPVGDHIRWGTKMGITNVSMEAEAFVAEHNNYEKFAREMQSYNFTPIFEWCSRKNRIVIDYPEDKLILTAIRGNNSGHYMPHSSMVAIAENHNIPVVGCFLINSANTQIHELIDSIRGIEDAEGIVIRFDDGHMLKIKGDWYCQIHKCKESLAHEKNLVDLIINEKIDDLKPHLLAHDLERVNVYEREFWNNLNSTIDSLQFNLDNFRKESNNDRKSFAIEKAPKLDPIMRNIMFCCWDGARDVRSTALELIKKNCGSGPKVDQYRSLWGNLTWEY